MEENNFESQMPYKKNFDDIENESSKSSKEPF